MVDHELRESAARESERANSQNDRDRRGNDKHRDRDLPGHASHPSMSARYPARRAVAM